MHNGDEKGITLALEVFLLGFGGGLIHGRKISQLKEVLLYVGRLGLPNAGRAAASTSLLRLRLFRFVVKWRSKRRRDSLGEGGGGAMCGSIEQGGVGLRQWQYPVTAACADLRAALLLHNLQ